MDEVKKVLVGVDASRHSLAALEVALDIAGQRAEFHGLFVEDIGLLRLAGLPFARAISFPSGLACRLERVEVERELRLTAARAREAFIRLVARQVEAFAFRTRRGEVASEVVAASREVDLVVLGKSSWPVTRHFPLGSTARAAIARAASSVLISQYEAYPPSRIIALYGGSRPALEAARKLAASQGRPLEVLIVAEGEQEAKRLREEAGEGRWVRPAQLPEVLRARDGMVVTGELPEPWLHRILTETRCPLLLVRG